MKNSLKSVSVCFKYERVYSTLILISFIISGVIPPLETLILEHVLVSIQHKAFAPILILILLLPLLAGLAGKHLLKYATLRLNNTLSVEFESDYLNQLIHLEYACYEDPDTRDAIARFSSPASSIADTYIALLRLFSYCISIAGYLFVFFSVSAWTLPAILVLFAVSAAFGLSEVKKVRRVQVSQTAEQRKACYIGNLFTSKASLKEMKLFGFSDYLIGRFHFLGNEAVENELKVTRKGFLNGIVSQLLNLLISAAGIFLLIVLALRKETEMSRVIALATALPTLTRYAAWQIPLSLSDISQKNNIWKDYGLIISCPKAKDGTAEQIEHPVIEFHNVFFTYPGANSPVLKGFSAVISPDENTAIVGMNGCGKSTVIKLILGLYHADSGEITVGGIPLEQLSRKEKVSLFAAVFQDYPIYQTGIEDNISVSDSRIPTDSERISGILSHTNLTEMIERLPNGLHTKIGRLYTDGIELSGGEGQKIAIARGLYSSSKFLILDEPTAALDPKTESQIYESFAEMFKQRSCIIISHRLAVAKMADKILFVENGRVEETGTHDELMRLNGKYAKMFTAQAQWYLN